MQESYSYKDLDILPSPAWPSFVVYLRWNQNAYVSVELFLGSSLLPKRMYKHVRYKNYIPTQGACRGCFTPQVLKKKQKTRKNKRKLTCPLKRDHFNGKCIFQTGNNHENGKNPTIVPMYLPCKEKQIIFPACHLSFRSLFLVGGSSRDL